MPTTLAQLIAKRAAEKSAAGLAHLAGRAVGSLFGRPGAQKALRYGGIGAAGATGAVAAPLAAGRIYGQTYQTDAEKFTQAAPAWTKARDGFRDANEQFRTGTGTSPTENRGWLARQFWGTPNYTPQQRETMYQQNLAKLQTGDFTWKGQHAGKQRDQALASAKALENTPSYSGGLMPVLTGRSHEYDPAFREQWLKTYMGQPAGNPLGPAPLSNLDAYTRGAQLSSNHVPTWASVHGRGG